MIDCMSVKEPERGNDGEFFVGLIPPREEGRGSLSSGRLGLNRGVAIDAGDDLDGSKTFVLLAELFGVWESFCGDVTGGPSFVSLAGDP